MIKRKYINKHALNDFNLEIKEGEIIGLIGSNGAGKTTLTKILSGIIHPTSGEVKVMNFSPWERNNTYRKNMAVIMGQKAQLWWDLPAMDGLLLLREIYQIPHTEFYNRLEYLANCLSIKDQLNIQVRRLSLGERMKVELIAALIHNPKVIFLDEPTIGLDLTAQKAVRNFIKEYRKEYNPTMILTSHYMEDIEELCERIVIMKDGNKVYDGHIKSLYEKYAKNKVITAHVKNPEHIKELLKNYEQDLGDIKVDKDIISIQTPRHKVMDASKFLLNNTDLFDFKIKEEEIGDIIERIMGGKVS